MGRRPHRRNTVPPQATRTSQANAAASAAAAEAGGDAADAVAMTCGLIRMGVFFDGTSNFRDKASDPAFGAYHTNPDLLGEIYPDDQGAVLERTINGQTRNTSYIQLYMRGIGVRANGTKENMGGGFGLGNEGVDGRSDQAIEQSRTLIRRVTGAVKPCDIWFDVFGFSRGAAAARDFANAVKDGDSDTHGHTYKSTARGQRIDRRGPKPTVQFMGLFDTVSSTGSLTPGETDGTHWVDLATPGRATHIFHITAGDEMRESFPLTKTASGRSVEMVGAHSDIGGGYHPPHTTGTLFVDDSRKEFVDRFARLWNVTENGPDNGHGDRLRSEVLREDRPTSSAMRRLWQEYKENHPLGWNSRKTFYTIDWRAEHGLQFVALRLMHNRAVARGVPFPSELPGTIGTVPIGLDATLTQYWEDLRDGNNVSAARKDLIRRTYCHLSAHNEVVSGGFQPFLPIASGKRHTGTM